MTEDTYNARNSADPGQFKDRNEVPRNKRLNVNIYAVVGKKLTPFSFLHLRLLVLHLHGAKQSE